MSKADSAGSIEALAGKWPAISVLCLCEVLALGLWFSVSAVVPSLRAEFGLTAQQASAFSSTVAIGFVLGTLISAVLGLADRLNPRHFFMVSAFVAASANLAILAFDPTSPVVIALRLLTGACMAGLYPVGMKMVSSWARGDTGLLVGLLVGALTLGSASPHLFNALGGVDWRITLILASVAAYMAGLLVNLVQLGPGYGMAPRFHPNQVLQAWRDKALRLANLGYFGHMWELYAMWAWIGVFLQASFLASRPEAPAAAALFAKLATFAVIGVGALGCLFGGAFADRLGRTTLTMGAMAISGACALTVGFLFGGDPLILTILCLIWGVSVVADSAQFSSSIIELADRSYVGTMLTVQTCAGFLLTLLTIHLIPELVDLIGWQYAFMSLAIGPFLGVLAMARLRAHPDSVKLANGRK